MTTAEMKLMGWKKSKACENWSPVRVSEMSGKLKGMFSISTSKIKNAYCIARAKNPESICHKCYVDAILKIRTALGQVLLHNTGVLTQEILPDNQLPKFKKGNKQVRFEAFADLNNNIQLKNYARIAEINPDITFGLWTKNAFIVKNVFDNQSKPDNIIIIESAPIINKEIKPSNEYIDKVFVVYDKDYIEKNNIDINCGARNCLACGKCYNRNNGVHVLREKLK